MDGSVSRKGFTLIDLLLSIAIIGILGMLVVPQYHSYITDAKLDEAAGELVSGLQYSESLAVTHQRPFGLQADVDGNWFKVFDNRYKADPTPHHDADPPVDANGVVLNPVEKKWFIKDFDLEQAFEGVSITAVPAGGEILFYPDGHSSSSNGTITLQYGGSERIITINGATGRVHVQ
ncbi:MAG: GspH/FimT family pseudopilin [Deltaproteobacteria bacterium]|nr:GspH/FimT family pseudopilin [Deltaproteobacteria bacterium]